MSLVFNRAAASRSAEQWDRDDYEVLADGVVVGRIFVSLVAPKDAPWFWCLTHGHHRVRAPTHGTAATCEAAMAEFAKSWAQE